MERNKNVTRLLRTYQVIVPCDCVLRHEMAFYPPSNLYPLAADLHECIVALSTSCMAVLTAAYG